MDVWKEFDQQELSHSAVHHLVCINDLTEEYGYARVSDVARRLEITRGSASITLKRLKQKGFVEEDERRFLRLSEDGQRISDQVKAKKKAMMRIFIDLLGVSAPQAEIDTCKIEHLISDETLQRATALLEAVDGDSPEARAFLDLIVPPKTDQPEASSS